MLRHVLPNTMGPILVISTINLALCDHHRGDVVVSGIRHARDMPASYVDPESAQLSVRGEWWIVAFPAFALAALICPSTCS